MVPDEVADEVADEEPVGVLPDTEESPEEEETDVPVDEPEKCRRVSGGLDGNTCKAQEI